MIRVLDQVTIGQIAAGEVIERPLSVVKELVENAIDSGADRISVALEEGGLELIEVVDNGCGIPRHELALAVRRHATSKLTAATDLSSVATLGFRGEGLASIAAVSRLRLCSRAQPAEIGAVLEAHAEEVMNVEPFPAPPGTAVEVRGLFGNLPVRREYMRSSGSEFSRISSWLATFSLAYPNITFSLAHDGKSAWVMPSGRSVPDRLSAVFGKGAAEHLVALNTDASSGLRGELAGFISKPGIDRPDRRMQLLFINGRLLRSGLLIGAWTAAYTTFSMLGRHPYGVLFLSLPAEHVDSNVHPTKSDVRLRFGHQVFDAVKRSMAKTLHANATERFKEAVSLAPGIGDSTLADVTSLFSSVQTELQPNVSVSPVRVLAQVHATYIIAADGDAVILVDQHAAHERIAYEKIVQASHGHIASEVMLLPHTFELDRMQSATLGRVLEVLREGGLDIEQFGENSFRILATPAGYASRSFDVGGFLDDFSEQPRGRDARERVWASLACHSVVRAGEKLEYGEMLTLVERLAQCENPMHCPHGRPTIARLDWEAIARLFKRI
ncbi:MAG: DNA mismatch repair endonuclease MutL [Candidatus Eremiobacteraeota bacterium]|nr:DNA mismatch repair endonuclease MutL [Candidatus Eremiobacteraeota bacterium]